MGDVQLGEEAIRTDIGVVRAAGYLDFDAAPQLKELVTSRIDAGAQHLIIDLAEVGFVDSTVIGVFMGGLRRVREWGGTVSIVSANADVCGILEMMGLDGVMPVHPTRDDAVSALLTGHARSSCSPSDLPMAPRKPSAEEMGRTG